MTIEYLPERDDDLTTLFGLLCLQSAVFHGHGLIGGIDIF